VINIAAAPSAAAISVVDSSDIATRQCELFDQREMRLFSKRILKNYNQ
jgi:hypothetical protein